jgi:hypothetical protein
MRSTACWSWDARSPSASPDPERGWGECACTPGPCNTPALVSLGGAVSPLRGGGGAAVDALHARLPATSQPTWSLSAPEPATNPGPSWRES